MQDPIPLPGGLSRRGFLAASGSVFALAALATRARAATVNEAPALADMVKSGGLPRIE